MVEVPSTSVLQTLFRKQIAKSVSLRDQLSYYERLDVGHPDKTYDWLISIVRKRLEQVRRDRTRDELHNGLLRKGRALVSGDSGDTSSSPDKARCPKGVCRSWFSKGSCSKGSSCPYSHDKGNRGDGKRRSNSPGRRDGSPKTKGKNRPDSSPTGGAKKSCSFHNKGTCKYGDSRKMKHNPTCAFWKKEWLLQKWR